MSPSPQPENLDVLNEVQLFRVRIALIQAYLRERKLDGVLLTRPDNFAMATGGKRNYIWTHTDLGANALFVDKDGRASFVGNNIEQPRLHDEELGTLGTEFQSFLWFEGNPAAATKKHFSGNLASDDGSLGPNVHGDLAAIRALLTTTELEKYRRLGKLAAEAMEATLHSITRGMPEADIAARLVAEGAKRRCEVPVALIAADDRIAKYRHPLPTVAPLVSGSLEERAVDRYVMVVGCFLREGLVVSLTRFCRVAELPAELDARYTRICAVDALVQEATRPGRSLGEVFADLQQAFVAQGFDANEWHNHHQGGATGYAGRTAKGKPGETFPVLSTEWPARFADVYGQALPFGAAFAWNPSGPGVKSEDTFILLPDGTQEIVSATPSLPILDLSGVLGRVSDVVKSGMAG